MITRGASGRSSIRRSARGEWEAFVSMGMTADGKRVRRHVRRRTQRAVRDETSRLEQDRDSGLSPEGGAVTVDEWLRSWVKGQELKVAASTMSAYTYDQRYIASSIGGIRLDRLTVEDVERLYRDMLDHPYSPNTVLHTKRTLSAAIQAAVNRGRIVRNPVKLASAPKDATPEIEPLTAAQARRLLTEASTMRNGARWVIALGLGLRQGEALGLQWRDIDLEDGTLKVIRQLRRVVWKHGCIEPTNCAKRGTDCPNRFGGGLVVSEPKSKAGRRTIALPRPLVAMLREHRAHQAAERLHAGELWQAVPGWVFASEIGKPTDPRRDLKRWKELLEKAGVPDARLHDARHTAATLLLVAGVDGRTVMDQLGWSSPALLSRYQHVVDDLKRAAAQRMSEALWPTQADTHGPLGIR